MTITNTSIPYQRTGYFTKFICDYLDKKDSIREFYDNFPDLKGFKDQIDLRIKANHKLDRGALVQTLKDQYKNLRISSGTSKNIDLLSDDTSFTITTGHQLNLFTGPLYFLYKIISAINLSKQLKSEFPIYDFVPIYWMATEDHDFEEIQFFNFKNNKVSWDRESSGAVGRLNTDGLEIVLEDFTEQLGNSKNAKYIAGLFRKAYLEQDNLTDATRFLANELFGDHGLVILDADASELKRNFAPYIKDELLEQTSFKEITKTNTQFEKNYKIQVKPREINLFYLDKELRERIVLEDGEYKIINTDLSFSVDEILQVLDCFPEKFSPNVLMRPLYEEVILPNLCYIGGGAEVTYWLELKRYFEKVEIPFPIVLLRNSALLISTKQMGKIKKLNVSVEEIFLKQNDLLNKKVKDISEIAIDFSSQKQQLQSMFVELEAISHCTDRSFLGAVKAQEKKQLNGLENLEKRLLKAQKRKYKEIVDRITKIHKELFPQYILQERYDNFSEFYLDFGQELISDLLDSLDPLELKFSVIELA